MSDKKRVFKCKEIDEGTDGDSMECIIYHAEAVYIFKKKTQPCCFWVMCNDSPPGSEVFSAF